ncbi:MAG: endonuclease V [Candidatus Bathyarchaeota archaeon]|nr:MAG: endonuclease V [Candidatus Bathyarchaeota archaeon]
MTSREAKQKKTPRGFSGKKAHTAQLRASVMVIRKDQVPEDICYVAGVDVAYTADLSIGAAAVLTYNSLSLAESKTACTKTRLPYIPTLLSFREVSPAYSAIRKLQLRPDVFLVDGQGVMHPYRLGFASHVGLALGVPTIGVAKSPLVGRVGEFNESGWAPITYQNEVVGAALKPKIGVRPLYVSVGHLVSLERAIEIVKHCTPNHRVPKPIRLAHNMAAKKKRAIKAFVRC